MARKQTRLMPIAGYVQYLRTSDEEVQAPERSQAAQRRDIRQRLLGNATLDGRGEYIDNFTGTSADRRHYQAMLADARRGKFSHVFTATPDRFGRDDVEALRAIDEMTRLGITVRFASHPDLDPADPDDRLYLNILFGMAKRESAITGRRTTGGMLSKLLKGEWPWKAPDGYVNKEIRLTALGPEEQHLHARYKRWVEIDPEQSKVWRFAWDMLLKDEPTLEDICGALAARGYRLQSGVPFLKINHEGDAVPYKQAISRVFHNWFYAGWVVADNEWAKITPKTIRGTWEPIVTTEEFEQGLAILARRYQTPTPEKRNFYLLQGLVYMERADGKTIKLICSTPNPNRTNNGVAYYRLPNSDLNFPCKQVDQQIPAFLHNIEVSPAIVPRIRQAYLADVGHYTGMYGREKEQLQSALERIEQKEVNLWRAFTEHGMRAEVYEKLAREYLTERQQITFAIQALKQENRDYIANLDAALEVIAEIGTRYMRQNPPTRRDILRHVVGKVVIDEQGELIRLELQPPFTYLRSLTGEGGTTKRKRSKRVNGSLGLVGNEKSSVEAGCSLQVLFGDPDRT